MTSDYATLDQFPARARYGSLDLRSELIRKGTEQSGRARLLAGRIRRWRER